MATSGSGISSGTGDLGAGQVVTFTVAMSGNVTVNTTGGRPTLTLNDGGIATYTSGSGSKALTFTYKVAAGQARPPCRDGGQSQWCNDHAQWRYRQPITLTGP